MPIERCDDKPRAMWRRYPWWMDGGGQAQEATVERQRQNGDGRRTTGRLGGGKRSFRELVSHGGADAVRHHKPLGKWVSSFCQTLEGDSPFGKPPLNVSPIGCSFRPGSTQLSAEFGGRTWTDESPRESPWVQHQHRHQHPAFSIDCNHGALAILVSTVVLLW